MNNDTFLKTLWKYILQHLAVAATFGLFCVIFTGIFSLYQLEIEAVLYASTLCLFLGTCILLVRFHFYWRKHRELVRIEKDIMLLAEQLPPPTNLIEADYCNIVAALLKINSSTLSKWSYERSDIIDYYTTWVHQIKSPIAAMQLLLHNDDTSENQQMLSELFRIEQYTEMVLCYFRLDSSSSDFLFKEYNLDDIIRTAVRKYAPQFVRKRISLNFVGTDCLVLTDEKWLLFIVEQLLSNAIKYMPVGTITIAVDDNKVLTITDTGIGIAADDLPRIFEKGFTGYNGHADKKSTGLGLYLCKRVADKLSHRISINSIVTRGTTVSLDLSTLKLEVE